MDEMERLEYGKLFLLDSKYIQKVILHNVRNTV